MSLMFSACLSNFVFASHASPWNQPQTRESLIARLCSTSFPLFSISRTVTSLCLEIRGCEHPFLASPYIPRLAFKL